MQLTMHSFLHGLLEKLNNEQDFTIAKQTTLVYIEESKINDMDKRKMRMVITYQIADSLRLYKYLYNALLKYEGLGTIGKKDNGNVQHMGVKTLKGDRS